MKKFSRKFKVFIIFLLLFLIWSFLAPFLAEALIVEKSIEKADVIWVLGGSSTYIERNREAAKAYEAGVAPKIFIVNDGVFSGWNQAEQRNLPIFELSKRNLIANGVPPEAIEVLPDLVEGTNDEAELFAKIAQKNHLKNVLLVTSAYHSRRTLWTFDRLMLKNNLSIEIGLQTAPVGQQTPTTFFWWLSPRGWRVVGLEYLKMIYYWLFY